ncbi:MAG TPA: hypothetical protein VGT40_01085 [Methylomirabilota bacterium]|jgi:hypothetical protein|nr:hypothetical protein [Methylomirabilota bacterium]
MEEIQREKGTVEPYDKRGSTIYFRVSLSMRPSAHWSALFQHRATFEQTAHHNHIAIDGGSVTFRAEEQNVEQALRKIDNSISFANSETAKEEQQKKDADENARKADAAKQDDLRRVKSRFKDL